MKSSDLSAQDQAWMQRALSIAERGLFTTKPNPRVGCVIAKGDRFIAEGWHMRAGEPHAEINALAAAGSAAKGGHVFVSLEPCVHTGRTGPCTHALIDAGVSRVVAAAVDPNPKVAGQGLTALRNAGIEVTVLEYEAGAIALNSGFFLRMTQGRPLIRLKMAVSLDGRTAAADGGSQWITSAEARADVHRLRARSCAIVTGVGTMETDNPRLNARIDGDVTQPLRVIVEGRRKVSAAAQLFTEPGPVLIAAAGPAGDRVELAGRAEVVDLSDGAGGIHLARLVDALTDRNCNEVLIEAGPTLAGRFVASGLVDEIWVYQAPDILGSAAQPMFAIPEIHSMDEKHSFSIRDVQRIGRDVRTIYSRA